MNKLEKTIHNIYVELYENSEPKADFNELLKNAKINKLGQKEIDFNSYCIDEKLMTEIVEKHVKKLRPYEKSIVSFQVYLGASPRGKDGKYYKNKFKLKIIKVKLLKRAKKVYRKILKAKKGL